MMTAGAVGLTEYDLLAGVQVARALDFRVAARPRASHRMAGSRAGAGTDFRGSWTIMVVPRPGSPRFVLLSRVDGGKVGVAFMPRPGGERGKA
jgi:hypothetical protein